MKRNSSSFSDYKLDQVITITKKQLSQIIEAIVSGKYSWACVLILRSAQCNPLDYIPSRTYSRLIKANQIYRKSKEVVATSDLPSADQNALLQD